MSFASCRDRRTSSRLCRLLSTFKDLGLTMSRSYGILAVHLLAAAAPAMSQTGRDADGPSLVRAVDSIVAIALKEGKAAGMSVAVMRGADTLVLNQYGYADLELGVPTPPRAIYEIGSISKQFTAAAILQLRETGKLNLDDPITKYVPALDTHGHVVTLRQLLNHTSGLPNYTDMPEMKMLRKLSLPRDTLLRLVNSKQFDFAPGEAMSYSNTGYFLLGLVIEKISGLSYADYVKRSLFDRVGMTDSHYCSVTAIVKGRAHGYDMGQDGLLHLAEYLDQTWPFAAGALCSTAGDLAIWTRALHEGRVLSPAAYRDMITSGRLNDGSRLRYAMGLISDSIAGHRAIFHNGAIPGFVTQVDYFPDDSLSVVVLINSLGSVSPVVIARSIAESTLGSIQEKEVRFRGNPVDYVGEYRNVRSGEPFVLTVAQDSAGILTIRNGQDKAERLVYRGNEMFAASDAQYTFVRSEGKVTKMRADLGYTNMIVTRKP